MSHANIEITTDPDRVNLEVVHGFLTQTYWATGRTLEQVQQSIDHSTPFSLFLDEQQIGFARVLSDRLSLAYLLDVFVLPEHRGQGYATKLMEHILASSQFASVQLWLLKTADAQPLYRKVGFAEVRDAERLMALER